MSKNLCATIGANPGGPDCEGQRETPVKLVVGAKEFTPSDYADEVTFTAELMSALLLDNGNANKLFAFPEILQITDNTEADSTGSLALGPIEVLKKGRASYTYFHKCTHTEFQKLRAFDGKTVPGYTLDSAKQFWVTYIKSNGIIKGELVKLAISGNGFKDSSSIETGVCKITVSYVSESDFNDRSKYVPLPNIAAGDLKGLMDVTLVEPQAHSTNVYKIQAVIKTAALGKDLNLHDDYGTLLAAATWTAGSGTNYATSMPVTSVAVDNTLKALTFTLDSTAYGLISSGGKIKVTPPSVATLNTAGVTGVEISPIILTK